MIVSELITAVHLNRQALIYVRQSSPQQTLTNQESLHLQYALRQRARDCGWDTSAIDVIDCDLGLTGSTTQGRRGFQEVVTKVTLGQVGIIFSYDVTRLSRNCSDWYQLLDLCGYRQCLIGDRDGIYDPASANGRLLLGLKGQISELELHTLQARLTAGRLNKAQRGELALKLPAGLVRDELGRVLKHPDREVQDRLALVFSTFLQLKAACRVARFLNEHGLLVPRSDHWGDIVWRPATEASINAILTNPAYSGAFVYGRTRATPRTDSPHQRFQKRLPVAQWKIRVPDRYPAYVDWETYLSNQAMLRDNRSEYDRHQTRGVPRRGKALLHGIVYCGECGHKLAVGYRTRGHYICNHLRQRQHVPVCQYLQAGPIDTYVVQAFFDVLAPAELDVYAQTVAALKQEEKILQHARRQQLDRLRYQARLAERQFNQADPDNRLVTAELEKRWEMALQELKCVEESHERDQQQRQVPAALSPEIRQALEQWGQKLPELWYCDALKQSQRKALLRCLIDKVVLQRTAPDTVRVRIVWKGGDTTLGEVAMPVASLARLSGIREMEKAVLHLAKQGKRDEEVAQWLTQNGHRSPHGSVVVPSTVQSIRLRHGLLRRCQSHPRQVPGYLTVPQIARKLKVSGHWIYHRIRTGRIRVAKHRKGKLLLFPKEPETINLFRQLRDGTVNYLCF